MRTELLANPAGNLMSTGSLTCEKGWRPDIVTESKPGTDSKKVFLAELVF